MTMHELEALLEQHCPSAPPRQQQGRAGVTVRPNRNGFAISVTRHYCPICGREIHGNSTKVYCSDACKQKAYRRRKQALRMAA